MQTKVKRHDYVGMTLFLLPALLLFGVFFIYPAGMILLTSFTRWDGLSAPVWSGGANYSRLISDTVFLTALKNNLLWVAAGTLQVGLATGVALLLAKKPRGWKVLRTIYFFPNVISGIALAMLWTAIFNGEYGLLNSLLQGVGLTKWQCNWLGDLQTALPAMLIHGVFYIGYYLIIILAEIATIPESYYEAASLDGAGGFAKDWFITLPLIKGSVLTCLTLAQIYGLRQFEQVLMMTNGGPANSTAVIVLYLYNKLQDFSYGLADTAAVILIGTGALIMLGVRQLFRLSAGDEG